ncbi:MAG: hypothetical protein CMG75_07695 [Candidatus Marinimicrobia bacterium]|nr:hypothetical protein [Candidatus Neomarinimicrobiota bacterium]|tara:strand:+ start:28107 stop:29426 length:1320 start_codon:yes stop_codon:yes gene_type:complete
MIEKFQKDEYPGEPKILFIGLAESTHTHAWIELLTDSNFNVRLFGLPSGYPSHDFPIRTYNTYPFKKVNSDYCKNLYQGKLRRTFYYLNRLVSVRLVNRSMFWRLLKWFWKSIFELINSAFNFFGIESPFLTPEIWLKNIIIRWEPDIIHTLGLYDSQGGMFYYNVRKKYKLENYGKWILQLRGGSDLTLRRHDSNYQDEIYNVLQDCYQIISDNIINIKYAKELGVPSEKFASIVPVPGTGGLDVKKLNASSILPSKRQRIILWPKAYESVWSKAIPVLESIRKAWGSLNLFKFYFLAMTSEVFTSYLGLPEEIKKNCIVFKNRIPRQEVLDLMKEARVVLIPSLIDGIPNSLYESMACGAFPIVSPLETIKTVVKERENVLFARNLYPDELATALILAMSDDSLVDNAVIENNKLVKQIADRKTIRSKVIEYYYSIL